MIRKTTAALAALVCLVGLGACSNPEDSAAGKEQQTNSDAIVEKVQKDDTVAELLPEDIRSKGGFAAAINADFAPIKFVDADGKITGLNPDLLRAAAKVLGTEVKFQEGTFDSMVPGLEAKRFDVIASVGDFVERQKKIDFIDYMKAGTAIMAHKGVKQDEVTADTLCGLSIGYTRGSAQQAFLEEAAKKCEAAGQPALEPRPYQDSGAGILSVKSAQDDAFWGDSPQVVYNVEQHPDLYKTIFNETNIVYGIGIHKDNTNLRDALRAALLKLVETGVYEKLLAAWKQQDLALPEMPINSDISQEG
ncbi:ABC transporter substrate-binding protein [Micromonospora sp. B11E3]|uniref:ABC transporter substrate-binding protein n=1 Tax=unclassified Micromonospora TaxID=2617518 RepID=UPI00325F5F34